MGTFFVMTKLVPTQSIKCQSRGVAAGIKDTEEHTNG